jgi:hypothetical protein
MTCGGIEDEDERRKRSGFFWMISLLRGARVRMAWCMVGTAVYQVGWHSSIQPKNFSASKPGEQNTSEPAEIGASTPAIRPWIWNSGMMLRPRSAVVKARVRRMLPAEAHRFFCDSGTIFGREVVPEVCSTMATSSGWAKPPVVAGLPAPAPCSEKLPAPGRAVGHQFDDGYAELGGGGARRGCRRPAWRSAVWR